MSVAYRTRWRGLAAILIAMGAATAAGCNPCWGVAGCRDEPRAAVVGQIVDEITGRPVPNVSVEMRHVLGGTMDPPVIATTTGSDGIFELDAAASAVGEMFVDISVAAPGLPSYVAADVPIRTSTRRGEAEVFHPWVSAHPSPPYAFRVVDQASGAGVPNALVEFRRTSGRNLFVNGAPISLVSGTTEADGYVFPFTGVATDTTGHVIGDVRVMLGGDTVAVVPSAFNSVARFREHHVLIVLAIDTGGS